MQNMRGYIMQDNDEANRTEQKLEIEKKNRALIAIFVAPLVTLIAILVAFIVLQLTYSAIISAFSLGSNEAILGRIMIIIALASIYLALPMLMNSKYGWKTVLWTYIVQSIVVGLSLMLIVGLMTGSTSSKSDAIDCSKFTSSLEREGCKGNLRAL